jgi:tetratricopeptide (TPR) repeat protein
MRTESGAHRYDGWACGYDADVPATKRKRIDSRLTSLPTDVRRLRAARTARERVSILRTLGPKLFDTKHRDLVLTKVAELTIEDVAADARLSYLAAAAATLRHDRKVAIQHLINAQAIVKPNERALIARVAFELGYLYLSRDERAAADATLLSAQEGDETARPSADIDHLRALIADAVGDYRQARVAYRAAISHSSRALTPATRVLALTNLAVSLNHAEPHESVSLCNLALATLDARQLHPQIRPSVRNVLGYALVCLGDLDDARQTATAARDEAREMDQQLVELFASFNLGIIDELQGRRADAEARLSDVSKRARTDNLTALDGWTAIRRAWLRLCEDDAAGARHLLRERFGVRMPPMHSDSLKMLRALLDLQDRRYTVARQAFLELARSYREKDDQLDRFAVLLWLATVDRESGREDLARKNANEACLIGRNHGFRVATNFWGPELAATARAYATEENKDFADGLITLEKGATPKARRSVVIGQNGTITVDGRTVLDDIWRHGGTGRRQLRLLFETLRAAYPAAIDRDRLTDLLWPDSEGDRAIANLYAAINDLRHVLADLPGVTVRLKDQRYGIHLAENARIERPPGGVMA